MAKYIRTLEIENRTGEIAYNKDYIRELHVCGNPHQKVTIENAFIDKLYVANPNHIRGNLKIRNCEIRRLYLHDISEKKDIVEMLESSENSVKKKKRLVLC